jgi:uncharacterized protein YdbL (DUF1318 family)
MSLTLNEYQDKTKETALYGASIRTYVDSLAIPDPNKRDGLIRMLSLNYAVLGLAGEAGEICNDLKKIIRDSNMIMTSDKRERLINELGDAEYYGAAVASELGMSLEDVAQINVQKLADRKARGVIVGSGNKR